MNEAAKLQVIEAYRQHSESLPDLLGIQLVRVGDQKLSVSLEVTPNHLNPAHTSCHAATMVAIADTACGWAVCLELDWTYTKNLKRISVNAHHCARTQRFRPL